MSPLSLDIPKGLPVADININNMQIVSIINHNINNINIIWLTRF